MTDRGERTGGSTTLDAQRAHDLILRTAERQVATAEVARRIVAAGLRDDLVDLLRQVAANAANPIACAAEDAIAGAVAGMLGAHGERELPCTGQLEVREIGELDISARRSHTRENMAKLSPVDQERLDVIQHLTERFLDGLKGKTLKGKDLERMKLVEQAVSCLEQARLA